jgi:hypothetical protein
MIVISHLDVLSALDHIQRKIVMNQTRHNQNVATADKIILQIIGAAS